MATVLDPPEELLSQLQKALVDFFGGGHYWFPPGVLCLPVFVGVQGLIHLASKVKAIRLQTAQTLLYLSDSVAWISFGLAILRGKKNKMYFDKQMFLISENVVKDMLSVFEAWSYFKLERKDHFGFDEPLFHKSLVFPKNVFPIF